MKKLFFAAVAASALALAGCQSSSGGHGTDGHWDYTDPAGWGDLDPAYETCSIGVEQSPIDIVTASATVGAASDLITSYTSTELVRTNNGHTLQVEYANGSTMTVGGVTYDLLQFHFHEGSEHTIDGVQSAMEMHFVHSTVAGELAVLGVMIDAGGVENTALKPVFDNFSATEVDSETVTGVTVDASAILPGSTAHYEYNGSLTTPPCTEGVKWNLLTTPIQISDAQLAQFTAIHTGNFRPTQPLGARTVTLR